MSIESKRARIIILRMLRSFTSVFTGYIKNYKKYRAITISQKVYALTLSWAVIGYSTINVAFQLWGRLVLGLLAIVVAISILGLRTVSQET